MDQLFLLAFFDKIHNDNSQLTKDKQIITNYISLLYSTTDTRLLGYLNFLKLKQKK